MALFGFQAPSFRFRSENTTSPLESALASATDATSIVVPDDVMSTISAAAKDATNRRTIMRHVAQCLNATQGSQWRRVYLAIVILEQLMPNRELVLEISEGVHFDLGMRMAFLEKFEYSVDDRVQNIVRQKAKAVHVAYRKVHDIESELAPASHFEDSAQDASTTDCDSNTDASSATEEGPRRQEVSSATPYAQAAFDLLCADDADLPLSGASVGLQEAPVVAPVEPGQTTADLLDLFAASDTSSHQQPMVAPVAPFDDLRFASPVPVTHSTQPELVDLL